MAEVLAALLFMAIVIPVAMHGVSVASRAGMLGQRKAQAIRIAERVLAENIVLGLSSATASGTAEEGDTSFEWTITTVTWPEDAMNEVTAKVTFQLQGNAYEISVSTLVDPAATSGGMEVGA